MLLLAACSSSESAGSDSEGGSSDGSRIDRIKESGVLRVGTFPDAPGWGSINAQNEYEGFDPDVARLLAERLGVEVEFVPADGVNRIPLLESDKVDVIMAGFTITEERKESVDFVPYASSGQLPVYRKDNPIKDWDDLLTKHVGVARGTSSDATITEQITTGEITRFDSESDTYMALKSGKVDALLMEDNMAYQLVAENDDLEVLPEDPRDPLPMGIGVAKGETEWQEYIQEFIDELYESGELEELYAKHFNGLELVILEDE